MLSDHFDDQSCWGWPPEDDPPKLVAEVFGPVAGRALQPQLFLLDPSSPLKCLGEPFCFPLQFEGARCLFGLVQATCWVGWFPVGGILLDLDRSSGAAESRAFGHPGRIGRTWSGVDHFLDPVAVCVGPSEGLFVPGDSVPRGGRTKNARRTGRPIGTPNPCRGGSGSYRSGCRRGGVDGACVVAVIVSILVDDVFLWGPARSLRDTHWTLHGQLPSVAFPCPLWRKSARHLLHQQW